MRSNLCALLAAACWWAAGSPSLANADQWKTAASGVWSVGSNWVDGSAPGNGDTATFAVGGAYTIVGYGSRNGNAEAFVAVISNAPKPPGDFDHDGDVDGDDLLQWQGDFGQNGLSDADEDGDSDGADLLVWQRNLSVPAVPAEAVPEPTAGVLSLLGVLGLLIFQTRNEPC